MFFPEWLTVRRTLVITLSIVSVIGFLALAAVSTRLILEYRQLAIAGEPASAAIVIDRIFGGEKMPDLTITPPPAAPTTIPSLLSGLPCQVNADRRLVASMIENTPASRAQMRGLAEAPIVYEAMAEGGITRFLAIFDCQALTKVGPVRSARPYYVDWASEYAAGYLHAGGSPAALELLNTARVYQLDEDGEILYRDFEFTKPHNLFADLTKFKTFLTEKGWTGDFKTPRFGAMGLAAPISAVANAGVTLNFSNDDFRVEYTWDAVEKNYVRKLADIPHVDATGKAIRPANVIVQFTDYGLIVGDEKERLDFRTTGTGTAWFFSDGKCWMGTWKKPITKHGVTEFLDGDGLPVSLTPGQTFIEVIDDPARVTPFGPSVNSGITPP